MVEVKDLTQLTLKDLWQEVKSEEGDFFGDLKDPILGGIKVLTETAMDSELLEQLQASRYQRTEIRKGSRNCYRVGVCLPSMAGWNLRYRETAKVSTSRNSSGVTSSGRRRWITWCSISEK